MATEGVGALEPNHLQLADVLRVDVSQRAMTREAEITTRCRPLVGVLHSGKLLLIGACHRLAGQTHRHRDDGASQNSKLHIHVFLLSLATQFTERKLSSSLKCAGGTFLPRRECQRAPSPCVLQ